MKSFQVFYEENAPPGPNRRTVLFEFCTKALADASEFLFKNANNELYLQKQIYEDQVKKLQAELKEIKDENRTKID